MDIVSSLIFFDYKISQSIIYLRSDFFDQFFIFITWLGSWPVIIFLVICLSILFCFYRKGNLMLPLFISVAGSGLMTIIIKYLVDRSRPGVDIALYLEKLPSFPSAHAALVFAFFGYLLYLVWKFNYNLTQRFFLSFIFILIIILIGFSRLYLGVHFLSDVIAGYLIGLAWVLVAVYISQRKTYFKR